MQFVRDTDMQFLRDNERGNCSNYVHSKDPQSSQVISMRTIEAQITETQINEDSDELFLWEKYSTGVVSKIMEKMGYKGKGLSKVENGIV